MTIFTSNYTFNDQPITIHNEKLSLIKASSESKKCKQFLDRLHELLEQYTVDPGCGKLTKFYAIEIKEGEERVKILFRARDHIDGRFLGYPEGYITMKGKEYPLSSIGAKAVNDLFEKGDHEKGIPSGLGMLNGNRAESIDQSLTYAMQDRFWDQWKTAGPINITAYRTRVYPFCLAYMQKLLNNQSKVLEICAGDGEFAQNVFKDFPGRPQHYTLVERNQQSVASAQEKLSQSYVGDRSTVHQRDINDLTDFIHESFDIVVGIGALTRCVLDDRETALSVLTKVVKLMNSGGYLLLSGISNQYIDQSDLKAHGLEVKNCYSPLSKITVYLAQKKST